MEREYAAACRRLSGDWRALERGWALRRRALRCRQRELAARVQRHGAAEVAARAHVSHTILVPGTRRTALYKEFQLTLVDPKAYFFCRLKRRVTSDFLNRSERDDNIL